MGTTAATWDPVPPINDDHVLDIDLDEEDDQRFVEAYTQRKKIEQLNRDNQ